MASLSIKDGDRGEVVLTTDVLPRRCVGINGTYAGAGKQCYFVSDNDTGITYLSGTRISGKTRGEVIVEAGAAIDTTSGTVLIPVKVGSNGKVISAVTMTVTTTPDTGSTGLTGSAAKPALAGVVAGSVLPEVIIGYAMTSAAQDGDQIKVLLK